MRGLGFEGGPCVEGREGERLKEVYPNVVINVKKKKKRKLP